MVPYLGTFLKDLVMLDAASKDELEVSGACVSVCIVMMEHKPQGQIDLSPREGTRTWSAGVLDLLLWQVG